MNSQLHQWHTDIHEAAYLVSIGKIDEAQALLKKVDYELHDAIDNNQNK